MTEEEIQEKLKSRLSYKVTKIFKGSWDCKGFVNIDVLFDGKKYQELCILLEDLKRE